MSCENCTSDLCTVRGRRLPKALFKACDSGGYSQVDNMLAILDQHKPPVVCQSQPVSTVGTQILRAIEGALGRTISCGTCRKVILGLNELDTHDFRKVCTSISKEIGGAAEWNGSGQQRIEEIVSRFIARPAEYPDNPPMTFVWPYFHPAARGDELRWSIRSVLHHYGPNASILLIGDKPDWYTGPYIQQDRVAPCANREYRDMNEKMITLSRHPAVPDEFVWMMDDIYFIQPMTLSNLKTPRAVTWNRSTSNRWRRVKNRTMLALQEYGLTVHDYATHLPHHAEKNKLAWVVDVYDMHNRTLLWEVLYGNTCRTRPKPAYPFLHVHQGSRQFVNPGESYVLNNLDTAWGPRLHRWLSNKFPSKSEYER